ncbi:hypothetical protein PHMEG_00015169 [Phytophthora megakarya]|uniref:Tf2-1-like SH3-like domain-containing protein n=1 Tax=Phytophthora megakarya TaxID=4795 RepID=A0A225W2G3_9STRA|nr:hypothetical protein PHMEG_00015169 [Phytophthora megakarya]
MLRLFVHETQTDWDAYLPRVLFAYRTSYHESLGDTPFFSLYGRDPKLTLDLAFLYTTKNWKSNEVANYRRQLYKSLHNSRRMVERQLIKAQDRNAVRLQGQKVISYDEGDSVWVFQHFRAKRGEKKTKKLAFSWHGPYRVLGQVGENTYRIAIPRHPDKVVTVNVNRLKKFKGRWSKPYSDEVPVTPENEEGEGRGVSGAPPVEDGDPLSEEDLPVDSYVERVAIGSDETSFTGVSSPILDIVAKRVENRLIEYLALTPTYETFWLSRSVLSPEYDALILAFENAERKKEEFTRAETQ